MAIEVFNRYEKKFIVERDAYHFLSARLEEHMVNDEHNKDGNLYSISSIYYDTCDNTLIRKSMQKPIYREKLRLRAYGVPEIDDKVFVEIKKKVNKMVNKRRASLPLKTAYELLMGSNTQLPENVNHQVIEEIKYMLSIYDLEPKTYITYKRRAMFSREDRDFRVTFDMDIRGRRHDLHFESGDYGDPILDKGLVLLEAKAANAYPIWFARLLSEFKIYSRPFSKYGSEYSNALYSKIMEGRYETCSQAYSQTYSQQQKPQAQPYRLAAR